VRSRNALAIGKDIARDRRRFRTIIGKWEERDLLGRILEYDAIITGEKNPGVVRFYSIRMRALRHEMIGRVILN
jgi:hypothetical protein